jgi:glucose/arabinose dehydrogenase/cytochrome c2
MSRVHGFAAVLALAAFGLVSNAHAQSATDGAAFFKRTCASCHTVTPDVKASAGPGLYGVVGRKAGSAKFNYSDTLNDAHAKGTVWTAGNLDTFLTDPQKMLPGTYMPITVPNKADRANVIAYLSSLNGAAAPKIKPVAKAAPAAPAKPAAPAAAPAKQEQWAEDAPGKVHHIVFEQLPPPFAVPSASNSPKKEPRPDGTLPKVPAGFKISIFATDPDRGRYMLRAPNGDILLSVPGKNQVKIMHPAADGQTAEVTVFAEGEGFERPYGLAFYPSAADPQYLYVANVNSVLRIPYKTGDLKASGPAETVVAQLAPKSGASHWTRTIVFSNDAKQMFVSVGSATNVANTMDKAPPEPAASWEAKHGLGAAWGDEENRADVLVFDPDGKNGKVFASGLRNCVGLLVYPTTGDLLCSVNERDELGDNLPPDYFTRVKAGAYYGWPWYYIGDHEDPRLKDARPDLKGKATVPDVLIQPHSAPLGMVVYQAPAGAAHALPAEYNGDVFLTLHGSWNRATRTGSKVVRIHMKDGKPDGTYQDFMTGLVVSDNAVWGRPASVAVAQDGALLVDDDLTGTIWRIAPEK